MGIFDFILIISTIILSLFRNIFTKEISENDSRQKRFYILQGFIFASGAIVLLPFVKFSVSLTTIIYSIIYGALLITSQWFYTIALKDGKTGICSVIYSLGFVIPTISGMIFFEKQFYLIKFIGFLIVIPTLILAKADDFKNKSNNSKLSFAIFIAMVSSGGLGVMQKLQQASNYKDEKSFFVFLSFIIASIVSFVFSAFVKEEKSENKNNIKTVIFACLVGFCFGACNLLNTTLAGRLDSILFFPLLNVSVIILTNIYGLTFLKEKLTKNNILVLIMGVASVIMLYLK